jgi:hypothetical protein
MNKVVVVTRGFVGLCHMQVCAEKDATDAEILAVCNSENPSGTNNGWGRVIRDDSPDVNPAECADNPNRLHFLGAG